MHPKNVYVKTSCFESYRDDTLLITDGASKSLESTRITIVIAFQHGVN